MVRLEPDPDDKRHHIVSLTETGLAMRRDAQAAMEELGTQVAAKLGHERFDGLLAALEADWGQSTNL